MKILQIIPAPAHTTAAYKTDGEKAWVPVVAYALMSESINRQKILPVINWDPDGGVDLLDPRTGDIVIPED